MCNPFLGEFEQVGYQAGPDAKPVYALEGSSKLHNLSLETDYLTPL